jgi:hypothetical protein
MMNPRKRQEEIRTCREGWRVVVVVVVEDPWDGVPL